MKNPFTTTFSKIPDDTYIPTNQVDEIIENFSYNNPSESVYKITGVRGSGKTVILSKVEDILQNDDDLKRDWLVYRISPGRNLLLQFASMLYKENFVKKQSKNRNFSFSASVLGTGGGFGIGSEKEEGIFDLGIEIEEMVKAAAESGKKILIGIDEVSKTKEMVQFGLEYGKWVRAGYPIYLVCTGLYENVEQLAHVRNLTFFLRAATIKTDPLDFIKMTDIYRTTLKIDIETAKKLARETKGYPYAFQKLGVLWFKKTETEAYSRLIHDLKIEMFSYAYGKIWEELPDGERSFIRLLNDKKQSQRKEIIQQMEKPANYSVYRERLLQKGLIRSGNRGSISLTLPYFAEFVKDYGI